MIYGLLAILSIVYVVPLAVVFLNAFRSNAEISAKGLISLAADLPSRRLDTGLERLLHRRPVRWRARYFWNSVAMVVPATIISTALGAINGYVLSKWKFPGSEIVFGCMLLGVFMPGQIALLPWAFLLGKIGLANSVYGLILVHCIQGLSFTTLFFRNYYVSIPDDLIKAARIDGAGFWRIFWKIIVPLSPPIAIVTVIWQFTGIWNEYLFGVVAQLGRQPADHLGARCAVDERNHGAHL